MNSFPLKTKIALGFGLALLLFGSVLKQLIELNNPGCKYPGAGEGVAVGAVPCPECGSTEVVRYGRRMAYSGIDAITWTVSGESS
jgi:hypothetical protein